MESTIHALGGAVVGVAAIPAVPAVAGVAASHLTGAVRLNGVGMNGAGMNGAGMNGAGRGMWRGQPSLGMPASIAVVVAAPADKVPASKLDRTNKLDRQATKQFRSTVYEGPRLWKVPV